MPAAIPLVGAAFSIAGGVAAAGGMAAIAAGGLSALTLTSGLMIAGGALTGIGALTGNKKLMTLGSVLGLAGGVSSLASKAGETAATEAAAEVAKNEAAKAGANQVVNDVSQSIAVPASSAVDTASNVASQAGTSALADSAGVAGKGLADSGGLIKDAVAEPWALNGPGEGGPLASAGTTPSGYSIAQQPKTDWLTQEGLAQELGQSGQATGQVAGQQAQMGAGPGLANPGGMDYLQAADQSAGLIPAGQPGAATSMTLTPEQMAQAGFKDAAGPSDWWGKMKQFGSDATDWMKKNPEATKLGGGLVQGAMQYYGNQQIAEDNMKRQMAYQDWVRQRYSDSVRNLTVPSVIRTASPTNGIIGGARG